MPGKRGSGEGSIYQRPDGSWRGQIMLDGARHSVTGQSRKEVQGQLRALASDAARGIVQSTEKITVAQHLDRWLVDVVTPSVRAATARDYRNVVRLHLIPAFGAVQLAQLRPEHVQRLYTDLAVKGLSPKSIRNIHGILRRALAQAEDWRLVGRNVATLARPPRAAHAEVVALTPEAVQTLLAGARGHRWESLIVMALATGMRQGELLGVRWADVDMAAGTIGVRRQLLRHGGFAEPKTARGRRQIDIPPSALATLGKHRREQNIERLACGPEWQDNDLVWCTHAGKPLGHRNVLRDYYALLAATGMEQVPFHALRHTAATLLLLAGVHPKVVQERLGHATIGITLDTYSHLIPSMGRDAADRLDALFG